MYKLLLLVSIFLLTGCDKPQWRIKEEPAYANCDTIVVTSEGKYSKTYPTKSSTITFNTSSTCITFLDLLTNFNTTTCGTFSIRGNPKNVYK